ncbi:MupA/Atu3671 family FMN-dependent luciferase-like monooxygenase [Planktotalea arctica]|uniref:MupA/Atu3671 family FMN-dependent luciferase-like monooxygenase n=1 Tax=Planktotalea arctica TaxID=1481893 RepID=UPI000A175F18|nr:MupA/Atu3671 family FMN-dependent luciferase-like monooxygenase [Planktotalea arctica]
MSAPLSVILIGSESLTIEAGRQMRARGYNLHAVVTHSADVRKWVAGEGLDVLGFGTGLAARLGDPVDWIFSVANLELLSADLLALGRKGAVNFHDGPLPRYAGLNAPVWALLNGEVQHGITWHMIEGGVDEGRIIAQEMFDIRASDTAFTLNTRCFEAGVQSFARVLDAVENGASHAQVQNLGERSYFALAERPDGYGFVDHTHPRDDALRLVRALDHGPYWNPLCTAKLRIGSAILHLGGAEIDGAQGRAGEVLALGDQSLILGFPDGALRFTGVSGDLASVSVGDLAALQTPTDAIHAQMAKAAKADIFWRRRFDYFTPCSLPLAQQTGLQGWQNLRVDTDHIAHLPRALLILAEQMTGGPCDIALGIARDTPLICAWVPLRDVTQIDAKREKGGFAVDLLIRDTALSAIKAPPLGLADTPIKASAATLCGSDLHFDAARLSPEAAALIVARLAHIASHLSHGAVPRDIPAVPPSEAELLASWNATEIPFDQTCLPQMIEAQVRKTPDQIALVVEDQSLTYAELNTRANKAAHVLREMGVKADTVVGLYTSRSLDMLIGALAIMKAGGAYVPLDPAYPEHRLMGYLEDSGVAVIVAQSAISSFLPAHNAEVLELDRDPRIAKASAENPSPLAGPENLAYLIFTSGSTGRPKGVMVEHRNLSNFFTGMDQRLAHDPAGTWLAVTSLNFDISVLELFYTLARGFKLVVTSDEGRAVLSNGPVLSSDAEMDFSIYYWGNDDGAGEKKYELLLEGAKFADAHGFCAVWTPERHFHAFGGPYPNPSVTGAAVAAVTKNIGVRSGSCVAPLHHPARIAEEWAVIDNLTNGRAGLAMASGWQPDDFVLRPENTPPDNKPAMMDTIEKVRKLWRGEAVEFPKVDGSMHAVITQPRPVSRELPVWVTTAGNPETWKEAGRIGANVLTHLLGQSIDEVAGKITLYHEALREAGFDPRDFKVTLMLHTYIAETREIAREVAREPMKDYLRSAAGLIKQYAWAFPAFKRPEGVDNAFQLDLGSLEEEELEGILDFAFLRYFEDSGLFGTVQDCAAKVDALKRIGVNEVACLIDYGIGTAQVLEGLRPLAEVVRRSNAVQKMAEDDFSIAAQLVRHKVSHLQCTPSMARMICMNDEARGALAGLSHIMVGGEALPGALVSELKAASGADITNMYGPTETTIWSSTRAATQQGTVPLGQPIANTKFYVLDVAGALCPIGAAGELCIGGAGVTRGYWQRDDLTAERFVSNPDGDRMYRTGDLVRYTASGELEFLGRVDNQIKLRGYRIELGEIESALEAQAGVTQAVVIAREDTPGDVRLVGYVTGQALAPEGMRAAMKAKLPQHMVPSVIEPIEHFPLTPNKKVDRAALPSPKPVKKHEIVATMAASSAFGPDVTVQISAIWSGILGVQGIAPSDNFFDIGGHSLLAVQAHREIRDKLGAQISITDIFRFPVLSALVECVTASGGQAANIASTPLAATGTDGPSVRAEGRVAAMAKRRAMRAARLRK